MKHKELTKDQERELRNVRGMACFGCFGTLLLSAALVALIVWGLIALYGWIMSLL